MLKLVLDFLFGKTGRLFIAAVTAGGLFAAFVQHQRNVGAKKFAAKVETANARVTKAAGDAGNKSLSGAGGLRNPNYRN